ncbi:related to beta transducin-like protein [Ramularia collo-cygni]|uniref:Related to beta transducin-like protein n=1 Tax=Ramularia collo-cygni TaxID=112498 RepID=A0A2D3UMH8_9PEZI|nr:related to beta transducin-like protein [Ramularia collo-cygni]CZT16522.1 related to beta transducin-like protein [Ramularia collo-cygni]
MWMINTTTIRLNEDWKPLEYFLNGRGYAILSHRWQGKEISFQDIKRNVPLSTPAFRKIINACNEARSLGYEWLWVDTCCINKESQTELVESINSMFQWYLKAAICLGYLVDVEVGGSPGEDRSREPGVFKKIGSERWIASEWFSRGWTLQELLAPRHMVFYDTNWNELGSKHDLSAPISAVTGIDTKYLRNNRESLSSACIATKMSWMAGRRTTREEDMAYSLVGLFNINMDVRYGQTGTSAFIRLQEELLKKGTDDSLFAWRMPKRGAGGAMPGWAADEWGLLAAEPSWFKDSGRLTISPPRMNTSSRSATNGYAMMQNGVKIPAAPIELRKRYILPAMPTIVGVWILVFYLSQVQKIVDSTSLNCWDIETGQQVALHLVNSNSRGEMKRARCMEFASPPRYRLTKIVPTRKESVYGMTSSRMVLQPEERYD